MIEGKLASEHNISLKYVIPSDEEEIKMSQVKSKVYGLVYKSVEDTRNSIVCNYIVHDPILVGSYSKGTWLSGDADLDIFVPFDPEDSPSRYGISLGGLKKVGLEIGMEALKDYKPYTRYAEHPFTEAVVDGVKVNVVPCYQTPVNNLKTTVDRTPHHTKFMNEHLSSSQKNDVRLLKKFMKLRGIYGAEIETKGFSGYACECLIHYMGTFENVLETFANRIERKSVIGIASASIDTNSSIVLVDPVDNTRNLGSAISIENVGKMIFHSRKYLEHPSFIPRSEIPDIRGERTIIQLNYNKNLVKDNVVGEVQRLASTLSSTILVRFGIIQTKIQVDNGLATIGFLTTTNHIPEYVTRNGPEIFNREWADAFLEKNQYKPITLNRDGNLVVVERVIETKIERVLYDTVSKLLESNKKFTLHYVGQDTFTNYEDRFLF